MYRIVLPAEEAAVVDAGLAAVQAQLDVQRQRDASAEATSPQLGISPEATSAQEPPCDAGAPPAEASSPQTAALGDALVELAGIALQQQSPAAGRGTRAALTAQVDPLTGWGRLAETGRAKDADLQQLRQS